MLEAESILASNEEGGASLVDSTELRDVIFLLSGLQSRFLGINLSVVVQIL